MASNGPTNYSVGEFRPGDGEGIAALFRSVYGEGYPVRTFYEPEELAAAVGEGRIYSIVARGPEGKIIGATHLFRHASAKNLYEWGAGLVLKEWRNAGVNQYLTDFLHRRFIPDKRHIEELFGEAICNHVHLQKACDASRYLETGIEAALMPAEAYANEADDPGRVATLCVFRCFIPKAHRIFLPREYEDILRRIYARLDDRRELRLSALPEETAPSDATTEAELQIYESAGVARMTFSSSGRDFSARIEELEGRAKERNAVVFQAFLNLTQPWVGGSVDILRRRGYFFGAALPRWFDGDGLLMQKLDCPPDFDRIVLWSDFARELLEFIRKDREETAGQPLIEP
ncbi:MAG: hypothetical protein QM278_11390 [Pseudomonadota bacterium]|nr:hypothetical protein [Pseudomonadota bacterium]